MSILPFLLTACIFVIGISVGVTIKVEDFYHAISLPTAILTGLVSQIFFMPFMAYCISQMLHLNINEATGLILVGCAPGGGLSNMFCMWAKGDVSLSITMTTISTMFASFMIPLNFFIYIKTFLGAGSSISMDWASLFISLSIILSGTFIGMGLAIIVTEKVKSRIEVAGSLIGLIIVAYVIYLEVNDNPDLFYESPKIYIGSFLVEPLGLLFGYCVAKYVMGLNEKLSQTISLETGLQNSTLIVAIVEISFSEEVRSDALKYPIMAGFAYMVWTLTIVAAFRYVMQKKDLDVNGQYCLLEE